MVYRVDGLQGSQYEDQMLMLIGDMLKTDLQDCI